MPFRVSIFWKQQSSKLGGWSENFWNNLTSFQAVTTAAQALVSEMNLFKGDQVYSNEIRISDITKFRTTVSLISPSGPATGTVAGDADYPTTKLLIKLSTATGTNTNQWIGGVRDRSIRQSGNWVPAGDDQALLNAVFLQLTTAANGWALRVLDPAVLPVDVLALNSTTGIITTAANTIPDRARVRVKGVKGVPGANGIWKVTKLTDTTFQLIGWVPSTFAMTKGNPTVRQQSYAFPSVAFASVTRSTSHRVGKPGGLLGGRRKKRVS